MHPIIRRVTLAVWRTNKRKNNSKHCCCSHPLAHCAQLAQKSDQRRTKNADAFFSALSHSNDDDDKPISCYIIHKANGDTLTKRTFPWMCAFQIYSGRFYKFKNKMRHKHSSDRNQITWEKKKMKTKRNWCEQCRENIEAPVKHHRIVCVLYESIAIK